MSAKRPSPLDQTLEFFRLHPLVAVAALLLLLLGPFLGKAVHIDDSLFVWTADHILHHPVDFYGFEVNWTGSTIPMSQENCNPPLQSYLLAGVRGLCGDHELPMHAALFLVAFAAAAGIFRLAQLWCDRPLLATVLAVCTPVFAVSSTTLMCDVPMLALWVWAVVLWERALARGKAADYGLAMVLAGLSVLTKYSALTLLPLLPILALARKRRLGLWVLWLALPAGIILAYQLWTARLYGVGLITAASQYAAKARFLVSGGWVNKVVLGLAFTGGCFLPLLVLAPKLWKPRLLWIAGGIALASAVGTVLLTGIGANLGWTVQLQVVALMVTALPLLVLTASSLAQFRDPVQLVMALWMGSCLAFASVLNWTVSARSFLPAVPVFGILVARRLSETGALKLHRSFVYGALLGSASLCGVVALADFQLANSGRTAARAIAAQNPAGTRLWFEGHRGFQFYLQKLGGIPIDFDKSVLQAGDTLVIPSNGNTLMNPESQDVQLLGTLRLPVFPVLSTVHAATGAAFYGAGGCLPFVFGAVPDEEYFIYRVSKTMSFAAPGFLNNLAWKLATDADPARRNGLEAVDLALLACERTKFEETVCLGTLAAAYAEAGKFESAVSTARQACGLAEKKAETNLLERNRELLRLYESGRAYHEQ